MPIRVDLGECGTEMVLNVTREGHVLNDIVKTARMLALEFIEDLLKRFSHHITENIHSATMRHTNNSFADPRFN
jgi:hypothetical protein